MNLDKMRIPKNIVKSEARSRIEDGIDDYKNDSKGNREHISDEPDEIMSGKIYNIKNFIKGLGPQDLDDTAEQIYSWYSRAMERRDREPLEPDRFFNHFFGGESTDEVYRYGNHDNGFLLGVGKEGVFIPTHFAPRTLRGGYNLLKELGKGDGPVALFLTEDLADTLAKMPEWKIEDYKFNANFRGEPIKKMLAHNDRPEIKKLMLALLAEYIDKMANQADEDEDGYEVN